MTTSLVEAALRSAQSGQWQEAIDRLGEAIQESPHDLLKYLARELSLCTLDGLCPNVFFSALAPGTRIPPHFDDTLEHEAWNDSDALRVVLIFDLWNPLLSSADRRLASRLAKATREFS